MVDTYAVAGHDVAGHLALIRYCLQVSCVHVDFVFFAHCIDAQLTGVLTGRLPVCIQYVYQ